MPPIDPTGGLFRRERRRHHVIARSDRRRLQRTHWVDANLMLGTDLRFLTE